MVDTSHNQIRVGLLGSGIQHSMSPALHMSEGRELGLDYRYDLIDIDLRPDDERDVGEILRQCATAGYRGLNITHPCKQVAFRLSDQPSTDARILGAVNTVLFENCQIIGRNTDWYGFMENFRTGLPGASIDKIVIIGAGGAGSAVLYAMLKLGARHAVLVDTNTDQADTLCKRMSEAFADRLIEASPDLAGALDRADGLINCSPVGMLKYPGSPVPPSLLHSGVWVADIVYVPLETELLRTARSIGCRYLNGGGMTVYQAARAFEYFTGRTPDIDRMTAVFLRDMQVWS